MSCSKLTSSGEIHQAARVTGYLHMRAMKTVMLTLVSLMLVAATLAIGASGVGASTGTMENPAGMSCTVSPGDPGINETITFDFNGYQGTTILRAVTPAGSRYLVTNPIEVSASINPLGYVLRYRQGASVHDIPCGDGGAAAPPADANPKNVSCEISDGPDGLLLVEVDTTRPVHLRRALPSGGSQWIEKGAPFIVDDGTGLFIRYYVSKTPYDVPCQDGSSATNSPPTSCEYFQSGPDEISFVFDGAADDLNIFIRRVNPGGSTFVAERSDIVSLSAGADYLIRYRIGGDLYEVDCVQQPF